MIAVCFPRILKDKTDRKKEKSMFFGIKIKVKLEITNFAYHLPSAAVFPHPSRIPARSLK